MNITIKLKNISCLLFCESIKQLSKNKNILFLLLSFIFVASLLANDEINNDSLRPVLATDTIFSQKERLNIAISLIDVFEKTQPNKSNEYFIAAIELAEQINDKPVVVSLLMRYAKSNQNNCNYDTADVAFQKVKKIILSDEMNDNSADIDYLIASNYYDWSKYEHAKVYYKASLSQYNNSFNKMGVAKSLMGLSAIAINYGDFETAIGYTQRARNIYTEIEDSEKLAKSTLNLGVILEKWGKTEKALSYYNQAYSAFKSDNNKVQEMNLLLHIGDVYLKQNEYKKAITSINHALIIENHHHHKKLLSIGYSNLGEVYMAMQKYDSALYYQQKALIIKNEVDDKKRIAITLLNIGKIYFEMGNYNLSQEYFEKCLNLSREVKLKDIEIETLLFLSKIYNENNNYQQSLYYLQQYIKLKDIVFDANSQKMINDLSVKYEAIRIEKENEILTQKNSISTIELENERKIKGYGIIFIFLIIIISIIIIVLIYQRTKLAKITSSAISKKNKEISKQQVELQKLNKELTSSEKKYKSIVENAITGMYRTLPNGKIEFANSSLVKMLGYNNFEELKVVNLNKSKYDRHLFVDLLNKQGIITGREDIWIRQDGSKMYVNESAWVVKDTHGVILYYEGIIEDITIRKEVENQLLASKKQLQVINKELIENNKQLEIAKNEAIAANEVKSIFIANVSHEIRTPMNSIVGFSNLLSEIITNKDHLSHVNAIKSSSENLLVIINDVLDMAKIQADKLDIIFEPVSVTKLIDDVVNVFALKIDSFDLELVININDNVPQNILIDKIRIRQVLLNIIGNAIKNTDKGTITIEVGGSVVKPDIYNMTISITDTGIGIHKDDIESIFDPFRQSKSNSVNNARGTGLGLSISNRLVKLMGGEILLTSTVGVGSKFTIAIPNVKITHNKTNLTKQNVNEDITCNIEIVNDISKKLVLPKFDKQTQNELIIKFKSKWTAAHNNHIINQTDTFVGELRDFALKNENLQLLKYCDALLFSLKNFEIDSINQLMTRLGEVFNSD